MDVKVVDDRPQQIPTDKRPQRQGKPAKARQEMKFRIAKNKQFQEELQQSLLRRLKITDPTTVSDVPLLRNVVPARVPVSFKGVPNFIHLLWEKFRSIGTRPFMQYDTPENELRFIRICLILCEAKLTFAQMNVSVRPPYPLPQLTSFTEVELRQLKTIRRAPFPLAILFETIGLFSIDTQPVVPVAASLNLKECSAAVNYLPSELHSLALNCSDMIPVTAPIYALRQELLNLQVEWEPVYNVPVPPAPGQQDIPQQLIGYRMTPASVAFWSVYDLSEEIQFFTNVVTSLASKPNFIIHFDLSSGQGSAAQLVRFPEKYDPSENETMYYLNTKVSDFEEKIAGAFLLGYEYEINKFSRYVTSYEDCLIHGSTCQQLVISSVINV